jgi:hypothetical protein
MWEEYGTKMKWALIPVLPMERQTCGTAGWAVVSGLHPSTSQCFRLKWHIPAKAHSDICVSGSSSELFQEMVRNLGVINFSLFFSASKRP